VKLEIPPKAQGQTIEHGYGWHDGELYRRTHDRSTGTVSWYRADSNESADLISEHAYPAGTVGPRVWNWISCNEPDAEMD